MFPFFFFIWFDKIPAAYPLLRRNFIWKMGMDGSLQYHNCVNFQPTVVKEKVRFSLQILASFVRCRRWESSRWVVKVKLASRIFERIRWVQWANWVGRGFVRCRWARRVVGFLLEMESEKSIYKVGWRRLRVMSGCGVALQGAGDARLGRCRRWSRGVGRRASGGPGVRMCWAFYLRVRGGKEQKKLERERGDQDCLREWGCQFLCLGFGETRHQPCMRNCEICGYENSCSRVIFFDFFPGYRST